MRENNYKILIVDDEPKHCELMKELLPKLHNVEVDVAHHPEDATRSIELKKDPYPIVWSGYKFSNPKTDGIEFFESVSKISPLSSRLLCSANFPDSEMTILVKKGAIQTYISKPLFAEPTSSALKIGFEYYKVNVLGELIDAFELPSKDELGKHLMKLHVIEKKVGLKDEKFKVDFVNREAELDRLFLQNEIIIKNSLINFLNHWKFMSGQI